MAGAGVRRNCEDATATNHDGSRPAKMELTPHAPGGSALEIEGAFGIAVARCDYYIRP